ncbi:BTAD domain-containing putative transcriptional regulator [Streptomyces scabiei]|uniref:AfsR/SARP family transcriptional regulator n=1 Tax=Streptomyces scabiei TaxID=1930 RepID=UPI0029B31343|nr:BTAD domain-containing putative transcriptional regulator [Streptomyces scabiei]MDX3524578.1 BTAD domain-containing putative transcriptional regulator [Streptomyces scabiei]
MKIRLLGLMDIEASGRSLDVGPQQRRLVLAALAVDAGSPVSIDVLTERVWGQDTPDAPHSALYSHITRLRKFLTEAARTEDPAARPVTLTKGAQGYVLQIDRQDVDLHRIGSLAESARATHGERRVLALREAMALWRGQPLVNLTGYWAGTIRRNAESQFIGIASEWAAEEMRLGNAQSVADRLARVLDSYPLAEPLAEWYVRALCTLGRTSEALQCYATVRQQIAEQLGHEPGPQLRDLHMAVLRGELDTQHQGITISSAPLPRQLPSSVAHFVGRTDESAWIRDALTTPRPQAAAPLVSIHGAAGVGKSALAIHAAHQLLDHYPDGQVYVELGGSSTGVPPLSPSEALARLFRTLGAESPPPTVQADEAAAQLRSLVAGRKMLLVLDNASDSDQIKPLLLSGTDCGVIVTSRQPLAALGGVGQLPVKPLSVDEAVALFGQLTGAERVAAEPTAAVAIVKLCQCLPLAVTTAAARLAARPSWPLAELHSRLADEARRLDNLEIEGMGMRASLSGSYQRLTENADPAMRAAAQAFKLLSGYRQPVVTLSDAAQLLSEPRARAELFLERLVDAQLLETVAPGLYQMNDLLRLFAQEC